MAIVSSFEVIAQPLAPGVPNVPYVQQGTFLQITNLGNDAFVTVTYAPSSPAFVISQPYNNGTLNLSANYIDSTGKINDCTADFLGREGSFDRILINGDATFIFGVQYIVEPTGVGAPQGSLTARGVIEVKADRTSQLLLTATVRQVFNSYDPVYGGLIGIDESDYALPIVGGPLVTF